LKNLIFFSLTLTLLSCGKQAGKDGANGVDGATVFGADAVSMGVDFEDLLPGIACANGGISIFTFRDTDADGSLDIGEQLVKVKSICNGLNGSNGTNGADAAMLLENIASSETCPQGGVKISSGSDSTEVCNGINGLNGEQGLQGVQGIPGLNGADGSVITPVKFCPKDESTFPEYGLMIDDELFAVYWGTTPGSPKTAQAFLTKLVAGNYMSTGGNNCLFSVP
jgi:hypothetical protein